MALHNEVLALVLGGGQGTRLFPLTQLRSKPAVPIAGKYRLIDIPISNCLHADIRRIFVLTQFNSASLNRHIGQTYRMDLFSEGFVEILAAEQTPDNPQLVSGNRRRCPPGRAAHRAARRRLLRHPRRRSPVPHGLFRARRGAHRSASRHHDCRAAGVGRRCVVDGHSCISTGTARSSPSTKSRTPPASRRSAGAFRKAPRLPDTCRTSPSSHRWESTCSRATCCSKRSNATMRRISAAASSRTRWPATRCRRTCSAATGPTLARSIRSTTRTSC